MLAVGCSQDELFDPAGEGQRPLVIKATGLSVTEAGITRATVDGDWKDASSVGILIDNKVMEYSVTPNADDPTTATLSAAQGVEPFYWVNEQETKNVKAWYPYKGEDAFPTEITVSENQSTKEGFEGSDRLSAENWWKIIATPSSSPLRRTSRKSLLPAAPSQAGNLVRTMNY